jgi:hypothetical protein
MSGRRDWVKLAEDEHEDDDEYDLQSSVCEA